MDTYAARRATRRTTGHYRKPGTDRSYCGHDLDHTATPAEKFRAICQTCTKAEARDRAEAKAVAASRDEHAPLLHKRADVDLALVGTGRRVHYSPRNDETLCGRIISRYTNLEQAAELFDKGYDFCTPCRRAAEKRAAARTLAETVEQADADRAERRQQLADSRGANAYPLAVAAVRQFVRELPQAGALRVPVVEGSPEATLTRDDLHALAYSGHTTADAVARVRAAVAAHIRHGEREVHVMFPAHGMRPALYLADVMALLHRWDDNQAEAAKFERAARALDAVEHAEQVGARVETVEDAEALYATRVVTEAEAAAGTWRGEWIGEQLADDALFTVECPAEQGALFDDRATQ
jgi:hypothetical protein